ncbi:glycine/sarcosine/betaine reductase component B subunit [Desulfovibrio sp. OttesenSCG-928-C06]|nr:glycine/sarcosine/betaine reductase component B subunit [Desulfovibrio sp. OttesenSCG-928-C06]
MGTSPSTKETTLHHFRDPLAARLAADAGIDFPGVVIQATSDDYLHKRFVSKRTAALVAGQRPDGALVCIDAWGNAHIDFASVIEFLGEQGIPVVGLSFVGIQAAFVVTNPYMDSIVDLNKSLSGVEEGVLGDNTAVPLDAEKAVAILLNKIRKKNAATGRALPDSALPERMLHSLQQRIFRVSELAAAGVTSMQPGLLQLNLEGMRQSAMDEARARHGQFAQLGGCIENITLKILRPGEDSVFVNSILDVWPIAVKVEGAIGDGVTNLVEGARVLLTASDTEGFQPINGGAASGLLRDVMRFGRPGTPAPDDFILHVDVTLKKGEAVTRDGIMAAHLACDAVLRDARACLAGMNRYQATERRRLVDMARPGKPRIALVKMTSGVSAMGDTSMFPEHPGGFEGSRSVMDYTHNLPVFVSPTEYMDGIVHSLS